MCQVLLFCMYNHAGFKKYSKIYYLHLNDDRMLWSIRIVCIIIMCNTFIEYLFCIGGFEDLTATKYWLWFWLDLSYDHQWQSTAVWRACYSLHPVLKCPLCVFKLFLYVSSENQERGAIFRHGDCLWVREGRGKLEPRSGTCRGGGEMGIFSFVCPTRARRHFLGTASGSQHYVLLNTQQALLAVVKDSSRMARHFTWCYVPSFFPHGWGWWTVFRLLSMGPRLHMTSSHLSLSIVVACLVVWSVPALTRKTEHTSWLVYSIDAVLCLKRNKLPRRVEYANWHFQALYWCTVLWKRNF